MMHTPTGELSSNWPEPQRFPQFLEKMRKMMCEMGNYTSESMSTAALAQPWPRFGPTLG